MGVVRLLLNKVIKMGNKYKLMCLNCKEYFYLGDELIWWQDKELMYCLKDFLLSHTNHILKVGGDEWNCAHDDKYEKQLPTPDFKENDYKYSKKDYKDERKAELGGE